MKNRRIVILGASRGLGWETYQLLHQKYASSKFLLISRKISEKTVHANTNVLAQDFSKIPLDVEFFKKLKEFQPTEIIYCAGGGPFGEFSSKKWTDHEWAFSVNFIFPAQLIHLILQQKEKFQNLSSITLIGSDIAESHPDAKASSYCAAKHALKGLVTTLQIENSSPIKFKLFSPGYMATALLPVNSAPRLENKAESALLVAEKLVDFIDSDLLVWTSSANR